MMDSVQAMAEAGAPGLGSSDILDVDESFAKSFVDYCSGIKSREKNLRLVSESLEKRERDLEKRERDLEKRERELEELKSFQDGRSKELSLKEEKLEASQGEVEGLRMKEIEELKKIERREREIEELKLLQGERSEELRLKEGKLDELLGLVHEHIERLEASQGEVEGLRREEREKLKEIDKRERELSVARGLLERRLDEVVEKLKELDALRNGRLEEVALRDERFLKERREFAEEVRLANEKLKEKQRLGYGLIERLELALDTLGGLRVIMDDKLKEIELRERMAHESLTSRVNEADSIRESFEKTFNKLEDVKDDLHVFQQDYKTGELESKEQLVDTTTVQNSSCERESLQTPIKENLALSNLDQPQAEVVADKGQTVCRPREIESERQLHNIHFKEQGLKQSMLTDDHITIKPDKSVDWGQALQKDRETLEMLVTDLEKDLELMDGEICKILSQSSDPAKLVLDAVQEFCTLRSGKHDTECRVRRFTILLLDQLTKLSPKIQPCVTAAAVKFAFKWKSKLSAAVEDSMEALGFLHFVAAFHLSSRFNKNELFKFLKLVGQHKQTPDLCRTLGLIAKIPGHIQNLINQKEYLLASTYAAEYQLQHRFKQAAILNYYVSYSKRSANQQARNERSTFEAKDKATIREIADLRAAVAHIIKYGLHDEYSPNVLSARIQQLESNRASLRDGCPSTTSPADMQKQGNRKRSRHPNKWKDRRNLREASSNPQMPSWSPSPAGRAEHQLGNTEIHPGTPLPGFSYSWHPIHLVPMPHPGPDGTYKRHCPDVWLSGDHLGQFGNQH